jgi:hypothetical protein
VTFPIETVDGEKTATGKKYVAGELIVTTDEGDYVFDEDAKTHVPVEASEEVVVEDSEPEAEVEAAELESAEPAEEPEAA